MHAAVALLLLTSVAGVVESVAESKELSGTVGPGCSEWTSPLPAGANNNVLLEVSSSGGQLDGVFAVAKADGAATVRSWVSGGCTLNAPTTLPEGDYIVATSGVTYCRLPATDKIPQLLPFAENYTVIVAVDDQEVTTELSITVTVTWGKEEEFPTLLTAIIASAGSCAVIICVIVCIVCMCKNCGSSDRGTAHEFKGHDQLIAEQVEREHREQKEAERAARHLLNYGYMMNRGDD